MSPEKYVIESDTIEVPVAAVSDGLHIGLRQHWVTAEADGIEANLASGAGLGSGYLSLSIEREGKPTIYESIDVRDFLPNWIDAAVARADARAEAAT